MPLDWKGLLLGLVPLLAGIGIIANGVTTMQGASAEAREAAAWPEAAGRVTRNWVETGSTAGNGGRRYTTYTPRVAYSYHVGGSSYLNDRLSLSQARQQTSRGAAEDELRAYPIGAPVMVRYDPTSPRRSALIIEAAGDVSYIGLAAGGLLTIFGAYILMMTLRPRRRSPGLTSENQAAHPPHEESPSSFERYQLIRRYPHDRFSLGRDRVTGEAVFAIIVPLHVGHYTAFYRLSEEELASFLANEQEVTRFADGVERGHQEARHMTAPLSIDAAAKPNAGVAQGTQQHTFALVDMGMEYLLHLSKSPRYSLCRHPLTLEPVFEIPVSSGAVDYEEYYRINEAELALLLAHPPMAAAFAECCGRHQMDDRLIVKPGTRRGSY